MKFCVKQRKRRLNLSAMKYEYHQFFYEEIHCRNKSFIDEEISTLFSQENQFFSQTGLHCLRRNQPVNLMRRSWSSGCWPLQVIKVPSGFDCTLPAEESILT